MPSSSRVQSPEAPPTCSCATQGRGQAWPGATLPVSPGFLRASGSPQETVCVDVCRYRHTHTRTCAHTVLDTCTHRPRIPVKSPGLDSWEEGIYRPTGSRAVCLGARGQDRKGVLGRTAGPSMRGDGGRGRPFVAPLDSVSFIGVSETFSDRGTRRPPLWLALSQVRSGPALPRAAWHALAGRLGCPGGAWSMPPAESLDGHHGPAAGPAGSSLRVLGGGGGLGGRAGRVRSGG